MPTKFVFRILYIELIICGFFACVLVARNLCLSETGVPISCQISRRGNASGRGASDRGTSELKVKVREKGEAMNTGERRQDAEAGKDFQQIFLVSKDRHRHAQPKGLRVPATENGKPWTQREKEMAGNDGMESQWSEESPATDGREIMPSHNQLPEEQSLYKFLDMFEMSDWLSDKSQQGVKPTRLTGSKGKDVDSKAEWRASKVERDDETENDSKIKTRHAASTERHVNSKVFKSVISKAEPIRLKATIVAKSLIPRAQILDSEYFLSKAEAVPSISETVRSKEERVTDTKAPIGIPQAPVVSEVPPRSASLKSSSSSRTTDTPFVSKETNSDSEDLSSSRLLTSSPEKEQSKISTSSDENFEFFGKIWNALFRSYDNDETPEELVFDETDLSEAAGRDPEVNLDEIMNSLSVSKNISKDITNPKEDTKKSTEIGHSTEENEPLAAVKNLLDDAKNSSEKVKNLNGGEKETSATVKQVFVEASENTKDKEESTTFIATNGISSERERLAASLMKDQNSFDPNSNTKNNSHQNAKDRSSSTKSNSYNPVNDLEKGQHFSEEGKESYAKTKDIPLKAKDNPLKAKDIPVKATDIPLKAKDIPVKAKDIPVKAKDIPLKAKEIPLKAKDIPLKAKDFPTSTKAIDLKANDIRLKPTDISNTAQDTTEDINGKAKDISVRPSDIRIKAEGIPAGVDDIPVGIPAKHEDLSKKENDIPAKSQDTLAKDEAVSNQMKDTPTEKTDSSARANNTEGRDANSILGREEVKSAMFGEMENIMTELDYLGSLWEQLKPGMKLKNSDAVRKVLHAVSNVFGLENKVVVESFGKSELEETAAEKLRYDGTAKRTKEVQAQKEFKDVSPRDAPTGDQTPTGLRSKRSSDWVNRRTHVRAAYSAEKARRNSDSEERKYKRLAEKLNRESGLEEQENAEEDVSKEKLESSRLRKRLGYEDYIFGSNPGYVLTRQKRDVPLPQKDETDKGEEDAISRELANLLIEKVYDRVMKSIGRPKQDAESDQASDQTKEMQGEEEEEEEEARRRRNSGRGSSNLKRSKRDIETGVDMKLFCSLMKNRRFNGTDVYGHETDLYRQAVNSGLCLDFEMSQAAEHEEEKRELLAVAKNEPEKDDKREEKELVQSEATVEVEGKTHREALEEAKGNINNVFERILQRETKEVAEAQAEEGAKTEVNNERVVQREVQEEAKTEMENERVGQRQVQEEAERQVQEEAERQVQEEAKTEMENDRVVQTEIKEEAERQVQEEAKAEVQNERVVQRQVQEEAKTEMENERVVQTEIKEEAERQVQEEAKTEMENERVVQRQVQEEAKTEVKNESEMTLEKEAKAESERETRRQAQEEAKRDINNEVEKVVQRMEVEEETQKQAQNEAKREVGKEAENEAKKEVKMDIKEELGKEELAREMRDSPSPGEFIDKTGDSIAQFGTDAWDFTKEKFTGGRVDEKKRGVSGKVNRRSKEELKDKRRSNDKDKTERNLSDILNYLNQKSDEADDKDFERQ